MSQFIRDEVLEFCDDMNSPDPVPWAFGLLLSARGSLLDEESSDTIEMHNDVLALLRKWKPRVYRLWKKSLRGSRNDA